MNYIILDLEWNQPAYPGAMVNHPVPLYGEIIQIGAVKVDENFQEIDTFNMRVRPVHYRKLHKRVARVTGLTDLDLLRGMPFRHVADQFRKWCGKDFAFVTWGGDDEVMLRINLAMYRMAHDWMPVTYDAQYIFSQQVPGAPRQLALVSALQVVGEEPYPPHDALLDSLNTVRVCRHLNMAAGVAGYDKPTGLQFDPSDPAQYTLPSQAISYATLAEAKESDKVRKFACPVCHADVTCPFWEITRSGKYLSIAECPDCSKYFVRIRVSQRGDKRYKVSRHVFTLTDELQREFDVSIAERERRKAEKLAQRAGA